MSLRSIYISQVAACFDPIPELPRLIDYFYQADSKNMDHWKAHAQESCMRTVSLYLEHHKNHPNDNDSETGSSAHSSPSGYSLTDRSIKKKKVPFVPYTHEQLFQFVSALGGCIPFFGHLYTNPFNKMKHCWCPLCPRLKGWRELNRLTFIKSNDICEHDDNVARGNLISHLTTKTNQKNILHELARIFLYDYSYHFKTNKSNSYNNSDFHYEDGTPALAENTINPFYIFGASDIVPQRITAGTTSTARMSTSPSPSPPHPSPIPSVIHPTEPPAYGRNSKSIPSRKNKKDKDPHDKLFRTSHDKHDRIYYFNKRDGQGSPGTYNTPDGYRTEFDSNINSDDDRSKN